MCIDPEVNEAAVHLLLDPRTTEEEAEYITARMLEED